jgi:succinate dehydrogenase hydrophobic anchor subunit
VKSATLWFRISAVILLLFAAGHTFGFLTFKPPTEQGQAVREAMANVHFEVGGRIFSYGGFYHGFGLSATVSMLFEAFVCWFLGGLARRNPREVAPIGWALVVQQIAGMVLSLMYFGVPPTAFSAVLTICLILATLLGGGNRKASAGS